jgi:molybdopterin/thiamine biosynthesis adenylyltransferase/rhodanese-related sulfurtransferase
MKDNIQYERYQRQLILKGFGEAAQQKLNEARVLVIGAGGLGCPILQYLVAAGVGHIGIADHDKVSLSNLHRQILFGTEDVGKYKVDVVQEKMHALNSDVDIKTWNKKWSHQDCADHFPDYDVIVDATDNFASRYMINDAAVLMGKPLVFGAVSQYEGQVAVFNLEMKDGSRSVNYRDLFPEPPKNSEVLNCSEGGVLGVLPGIIGSMQATEVIKLISGLGEPLVDKLWNYQLLTQHVFVLALTKHTAAADRIPKNIGEFLGTDYEWLCEFPQVGIKELDVHQWKQNHLADLLVDIREPHEQPRLTEMAEVLGLNFLELPLSEFESKIPQLPYENIVLVCQAGRRSLQAASVLLNLKPEVNVQSLKGGVNTLMELKMI